MCEKPIINLKLSPLILKSNVDFTFGNFIEFGCKEGYEFKRGTVSRAKCLTNGKWSAPMPTCEST